MRKKYYLAYGSNLNIQQMRLRCPGAKIAGTAELDDWRLLFRGSKTGSYLTIEPYEGCSVPLGVWEVTAADEKALDRYEGFPTFYYKRSLRIPMTDWKTGDMTMIDAFVYIMHEDRPIGIPSRSYCHICAQGYVDFGFPIVLLSEAYKVSKREVA